MEASESIPNNLYGSAETVQHEKAVAGECCSKWFIFSGLPSL